MPGLITTTITSPHNMSIDDARLKVKRLIMQDRIRRIEKDISDIKDNHLHALYKKVEKIDTKQKIILSLLFIIIGVLIAK